ncbi:MAG: hypothetical protein R2761_29390 [Acidimicrobiales bacterium]
MTDFSEQDRELARSLKAEWPEDEGIEPAEPSIERVEPIHLLANEVRPELNEAGYSDEEIDEWARAFFGEHSEGSAHEFVEWIARQESPRSS